MIRDGLSETGAQLREWSEGRAHGAHAGLLPRLAARIGAKVPPLDQLAGPEHAISARLDWGRWCADCPCGAAWLVWLRGPHQIWCGACGNLTCGGLWRPVVVPPDWPAINAALDGLMPRDQNWRPEP